MQKCLIILNHLFNTVLDDILYAAVFFHNNWFLNCSKSCFLKPICSSHDWTYLPLNQKTAFTTKTRIMTFSSCKSRQRTQPDGISLPSIQCGHAKVSASHDYKRLMFNWLYRTLKQAESRTMYQREVWGEKFCLSDGLFYFLLWTHNWCFYVANGIIL